MDRAIGQSLTGLIPTFNAALPPDLLELAISLLAQSRSKAGSLKAEEEIARSYACANIACERPLRLKQALGLPKIEPRPPCPPRVYQKLYRYLDGVLATGTPRKGRPRVSRSGDTPTSSPSKLKTPTKPVPSRTETPKTVNPRRKISTRSKSAGELPKWVMPSIRQICTTLSTRTLAPHIFAGVSSILTLPLPPQATFHTRKSDQVSALVIAVYLLVRTRMSGVMTSADEYTRLKSNALGALKDSGIQEGEDDMAVAQVNVDEWMKEIRDKGWTELDWFKNVEEGRGLGSDEEREINGVEEEGQEDGSVMEHASSRKRKWAIMEADPKHNNTLLVGLGTMMRDPVDYLSPSRQEDYTEWKKRILARMEELKQELATDENS